MATKNVSVAPPTEALIRKINEELPEKWKFEEGQLVDSHGNSLVSFTLSELFEGYDDEFDYEQKAKQLFWAMAYGPDVMIFTLKLAAALYSGDHKRAHRLLDKILEYTATAFGLDREHVDAAVKPAAVVLAEQTLKDWARKPAFN
jgi:hypothetical protein